MAEDAGERTEQPTPRRRQEARKDGRVARSQDLTAGIGLAGGIVLLGMMGKGMLGHMLGMINEIGGEPITSAGDLAVPVSRIAWHALMLLGPFIAVLMIITAAGVTMQFGVLLTAKKLRPDLNNLSPLRGAKQMFSGQAAMRLGMGILKLAIVAAVAYYTIRADLADVLGTGGLHAWGILFAAGDTLYKLALRLALVLLLLGLADYAYQRWNLERSLKMTKQEVRDELKKMDGDPHIKRRQRDVQMQVAMRRLQTEVPKADVVVTNPTQYAVALRYDESQMAAPRVLAKGRELLALRIRQLAQQNAIPVVQRPPLARALYAQCEVGQEIPPTFYKAVAELLAYVYQLSNRAVKAG